MVNDIDEIDMGKKIEIVVLISADAEWRVVSNYFSEYVTHTSPFGDWFDHKYKDIPEIKKPIVFMHGGWGKVAAAASTQYVIDRWDPQILINLGTCGGFEGEISKGEIILAEKTIIYDIYEQMGDPDEHINHYITEIDNSWISKPYPIPVRQLLLVSGDRDLFSSEIPYLQKKFDTIVADWESGAIAWVSKINHTRCMVLRGVTDLVGVNGGEAYNGNLSLFTENTEVIMKTLVDSLPKWIMKHYEIAKRLYY
jgi:adenosylhomocysteine nucleosidase